MKISKGTRLYILGAVLVVLDQIIKVLVKTNMDLGETINVIGDWFKLHFVLNKGMAFGMAFGGYWGKILLSVFRIILFGGLCWWIGKLAKKPDTIAFLLPAMGKEELFPTVIHDGVLPRKTFSMGEAQDKRFYLEGRRIRR